MRSILLSVLALFVYETSWSYFSLMDTAVPVSEGTYRLLGEGQILFDSPEGFNLNGRFATGLDEESEIQFEAGIGSIDYYLGAFWKWIPFPDTDEQPGLGLRAGVTFADVNDRSTYGFNVTPMISKKFDTDAGNFSPYSGLIMGLQKNVNDTNFSMQLAFGLEWSPNEWDFDKLKDFNFLLEYALDVDDAFDYFSFGASYNF